MNFLRVFVGICVIFIYIYIFTVINEQTTVYKRQYKQVSGIRMSLQYYVTNQWFYWLLVIRFAREKWILYVFVFQTITARQILDIMIIR